MLTIFANMRVNSEERFEHLKDSFDSFSGASDDWLINIRGTKRTEVIAFLKERLGGRATFFELLDDSRGWATNALEMLPQARYPYILAWVEDHINVAGEDTLRRAVSEMDAQKVKCMPYSWHGVGWTQGKAEEQRAHLRLKKGSVIETAEVSEDSWTKVTSYKNYPYLISNVSIYDKDFYKKLLEADQRIWPFPLTTFLYRVLAVLRRLGLPLEQRKTFRVINRWLGFRLGRFSTETPFNLEKGPERVDLLPLRLAFPLQELFACIEDDMDSPDHSYSLVSRGMYPKRDVLLEWNPAEDMPRHSRERKTMPKGEIIKGRYAYYPDSKHARATVVREYIAVKNGSITVTLGGQSLKLHQGEGASFFTNLQHEIRADEPSEIVRYVPNPGLAPHRFST
jgi:hypothetical protein